MGRKKNNYFETEFNLPYSQYICTYNCNLEEKEGGGTITKDNDPLWIWAGISVSMSAANPS